MAPSSAAARAAANRRGVLAMVASMASFSCGDMLVKLLSGRMPTGQLLIVRGVFAVALVAAAVLATGHAGAIRGLAHRTVLLRSLAESFVIGMFVWAIAYLPLGDITAMSQSTPLIMTAFAAMFLGETVGWRRWTATAIGFLGVLLVAKPSASGLSPPAAIAIGSAVAIAARDLLTQRIPSSVPSIVVVAATTLAAVVAGAAIAPGEAWRPLGATDYALLAGAAVGTTLGNVGVILAFRDSDPSVVAPFRYLIIVFALGWSAVIWGQTPDVWSLAGIALIAGAGVYTIHRERVRARRALGPAGARAAPP